MSTEPNQNFDDQLKAYAKKRREEAGAPLEMHPATRNLLQSEVKRTLTRPPTGNESRSKIFGGLWPRMVIIGSLCGVLVLASLMWWQNQPLPPKLDDAEKQSNRLAGKLKVLNDEALVELKLADKKRLSGEVASGPAPSTLAPIDSASKSAAPEVSERLDAVGGSKASLNRNRELKLNETVGGNLKKDVDRQLTDLENKSPLEKQPTTPAFKQQDQRAPADSQSELARRYGLAPRTTPDSNGKAGGQSDVSRIGKEIDSGAVSTTKSEPERKPAAVQVARASTQNSSRGLKPSAAAPAAEAPALGAIKAEVERLEIASNSVSQQFVQSDSRAKYRRNFNSPPASSVLNSFQMVQNGQQIRFVDADNSTYEGQIQQTQVELGRKLDTVLESELRDTAKVKAKAKDENSPRAFQNAAGATSSQNLFFRATGTNLSLNQLVVFEGNLQLGSNQTPSDSYFSPAQANRPLEQQKQSPTLRIQGRALIGSNTQVEINAVPKAQ